MTKKIYRSSRPHGGSKAQLNEIAQGFVKAWQSPRQDKFEEIYSPEHNLKWDGRYVAAKSRFGQNDITIFLDLNDKPPARIT